MFSQFLSSAYPSYDLFGVAESRLGPEVDDECVYVEGYSIIRQDRNTHGGGVVLYIRNTFKATLLCSSPTTLENSKPGIPEYLMCSVQQGNRPPVFVAVIYRPPGISFTANSDLVENLTNYSVGFDHRLIMGDLNANMLSSSQDALFVKELACDLNLKIVEHGATHHTGETHTWIDVILTDDDSVVLNANNIMATFPSRHTIVDVEIDVEITVKPSVPSFTYRDFKSIHQNELLSLLDSCDWSQISHSDNSVDAKLEHLSSNLIKVIDEIAPLKQFKPRKKGIPPWADADLRHLINQRDSVRRRYTRTRDNGLWVEFQSLAAETEQRLKEARETFIHNRIFDALESNENVWRELRNLGLLSKPREDLHGFSPDELNINFAGVSISDSERETDLDDLVSKASNDGFTFREVTFSDVVLAVAHFSSQAKGEDGIPQSVIAKSLPVLGHQLVSIFNSSLSCGVFPTAWKRAHVVPLKKKTIPSAVSDFRPIALLSFLSKVLEKIVHEQISEYIESRRLLGTRQTGFRRYHSTQTALLKLTEDIRAGIDNEKQLLTILLLFDFSKAFDTISPSKLLRRLIGMGFSRTVVLWIRSYISGRNQRVVTKSNGESDWLTTNLGVPQGSVLGPLLFSLYIQDLSEVLSAFGGSRDALESNVEHLLYADDLQVYTQTTRDDLCGGIDRLSAVARAVSDWAAGNALRLNVGKTKAIIFGSDYNINRLKGLDLPGIEVQHGVFAPFLDAVTNLGVVMDSKLTWKPQVDAVGRKVNRALYGLRSFQSCTTEALRKQLASALAVSHLDYCSVVYLDLSRELQARLQRLQNSCIRYICGVKWGEHITPHRRKLEWLSVEERREYFMSMLLYRANVMGQPPYLAELFEKNKARTSGRTCRELAIPSTRTDSGLKSFRARGSRVWNSLPISIKCLSSLAKFRSALRRHLHQYSSYNQD